jgi:hypothetical protein
MGAEKLLRPRLSCGNFLLSHENIIFSKHKKMDGLGTEKAEKT